MKQNVVLLVLGLIVAVVLLGGGTLFVLTPELFEGSDAEGNQSELPLPARDSIADSDACESEFGQPPAGREILEDALGRRYFVGPDGKRIYIDEHGRYYRTSPGGKRVNVDSDGNPLTGEDGTAENGESSDGAGNSKDITTPEEESEDAKPETAGLTGRVVDDMGQPFEGATVKAATETGGSAVATTNEEGRFSVAGLPIGQTISVFAADENGQKSRVTKTRLKKGSTKLPDDLVLPRSRDISGFVTSASNGAPLSGVLVQLQIGSGRRFEDSATMHTDAGGAFRFEKPVLREYRLRFTKQDYAPKLLNNATPPANFQVTMEPGAFIAGMVTNSGGDPIESANVECHFHSEPNQDFYTYGKSESSGEFLIKCQPESQHNKITIRAAGYTSRVFTLVKSGTTGMQAVLSKTDNLTVKARLLTPQLTPIPSATLRAYNAAGKYTKILDSYGPDTEGKFWVQVAVTAGEVRATTTSGAIGKRAFSGEAGGIIDLGDIEIDAGYVLSGIVHERGMPDKPIKDCKLIIGGTTVFSEADGSYRFEGLGSSEFSVRLLHPAYLGSAKKFTPTPGEYEIKYDFELARANFEARAVVVNAENQQPLKGVLVDVVDYGQNLTTGEDGAIHLTGLSSMSITIKLSKPGFVPRTVKLTADVSEKVKNAPPVTIDLELGSPLAGLCTQGGKPLPGAVGVEVWDSSGLVVTIETDSSGKYNTDNLPPGTYFVRIPEYHAAGKKIAVPVDGGATCNIELSAVSHLRGKVFKSNGQPHANQGIYVYSVPDGHYLATVILDPEGNYEIRNLWVHEFSFNILKSPGDSSSQFAIRVNVTESGWVTHNIQLPQATGVVEGKVTYPDGSPVRKARVSITNLDAGYDRALLAAYVVTDDEGKYRAERLENGARMIARVGGYQDEAATGTGFSDVFVVASGGSAVTSDIIVATKGVRIRGSVERSDSGPLGGHFLLTLVDSEGRLAGLFFGGGSAQKITFWVYDVVPGTYTMKLTDRWMKQKDVQIVVSEEDVLDFASTIDPSDRR
ncbi:MAG: carboxypeptidase regulatory-like domain-containing protein [Planctomycetota bacterium]|jgi:hypothetical protein